MRSSNEADDCWRGVEVGMEIIVEECLIQYSSMHQAVCVGWVLRSLNFEREVE